MSTPTEDRQFLMLSFLLMWSGVRIIATLLGVWPWSGWIITAMLAIGLAFIMWMNNLEAT